MKILLALDASLASQMALEETAARPWPVGSSFEILCVVEPSHVSATTEGAREAINHANRVVQNAVESLHSRGWEASGGVLADDDPKAVIIDRARDTNADFIVVGSHGRSALGRFLLGSVAAAVFRYAPCSVEIVRQQLRGQGSPMKVLVATDGSDCSDLAVSSVADRPWPAGTEIRILSVSEVILSARHALLELPFLSSVIASARAEGIRRSHDAVKAAVKGLSEATATVSESIPSSTDDPKRVILSEAAEWGADLIVLGSHGRRGMDRFQLGTVSEAVALHAQCSVEVVRKGQS